MMSVSYATSLLTERLQNPVSEIVPRGTISAIAVEQSPKWPLPAMQPAVFLPDSHLCAEQVREDGRGQQLCPWAVGDDAPLLHEDDALDLRRDVGGMAGDEDHGRALRNE